MISKSGSLNPGIPKTQQTSGAETLTADFQRTSIDTLVSSAPLPPTSITIDDSSTVIVQVPGDISNTLSRLEPPAQPRSVIAGDAVRVNPSSPKPSPNTIIDELNRELPIGIELYRSYHYQVPLSKKSRLDLIVAKLYCPEELESKLSEWRAQMEDRFDTVTILVRRVTVDQNIQSHLRNRFRDFSLLTGSARPVLSEMINSLCGEKPSTSTVARVRKPRREDLSTIPFVAIDRPGTMDVEDLLHAERKKNGEVIWRTAFINATDYVQPASLLDKYALRVGSTLYGRHQTISTLGKDLSQNLASFKEHARRPAWVVEGRLTPHTVVSKSGRARVEYALAYKIRSAYVVNHRNVDPSLPLDSCVEPEISKSLSALAEVARILDKKRTMQPSLLRVESEDAATKLVAAIMIESKRILAHYLGERSSAPTIYKVHHKPSSQVVADFVKKLADVGIPAEPYDFETPAEFAGILRSLEGRGSPEAQSLLNTLIDTYLLRSQYSTKNEGHFGLRVDGYLEIKPRDASGLANQFQLAALLERRNPLPEHEMTRRASVLNEKRWRRDEIQYKLRFLEMLHEKLEATRSAVFLAAVAHVGDHGPYVQVEGFSKWGKLDGPHEGLEKDAPVAVTLKGFDLSSMRFVFQLAE